MENLKRVLGIIFASRKFNIWLTTMIATLLTGVGLDIDAEIVGIVIGAVTAAFLGVTLVQEKSNTEPPKV